MLQNLTHRVVKNIQRFEERRESPTEEATKHALVLPFISDVLGADYYDPDEVIPEFTADIGHRKSEKVDYAICRDGEPIILIECKALHSPLDKTATIQLQRYIGSLRGVSLGILTDGRHYRFHADLDDPNIMDSEPFLRIDLLKLNPTDERRLQLFHLDNLDVGAVKEKGRGWKAVASLVQALESEWEDPSDGYVAYFAKPLHQKGFLTESVRRQYAGYLKEAHRIFLSRRIDSTDTPDTESDVNREMMRNHLDNKLSAVALSDGWRPLTELDPTDLAPRIIQFEDGSTAQVKNWADLVRTVSRKLASEGHFQPVPIDLHRIIRAKPPKTKVPWFRLPDSQYIRDSGSATDRLNVTVRLLTASGYDPAKCKIK